MMLLQSDANDRSVYDDAPESTPSFNVNFAPSVHRPGIANLIGS